MSAALREDEELPASAEDETVSVCRRLLYQIAEDPGLRPSYRVAARRHLRRLAEEAAVPDMGGLT
jgi:hypothetical protein